MDSLKTILVFGDSKKIEQTVKTALQIEHYDHAPVVVSTEMRIHARATLFFTTPGTWNLKSLWETQKLWMKRLVVFRGDVDYSDETVCLILAKTALPINFLYYADNSLVAFSGKSKDIRKAVSDILHNTYSDPNDWNIFPSFLRAHTGRVDQVSVQVGGLNEN